MDERRSRAHDWADDANALAAQISRSRVGARDLPIELARIHTDFEKVHPFLDGNGRTGHLALNLVLVRLGFPPRDHLQTRR